MQIYYMHYLQIYYISLGCAFLSCSTYTMLPSCVLIHILTQQDVDWQSLMHPNHTLLLQLFVSALSCS